LNNNNINNDSNCTSSTIWPFGSNGMVGARGLRGGAATSFGGGFRMLPLI